MAAVAVKAGEDADAYCSKCKLVLAHVIIAVKGTRPAKVECKTCKAVHAFKKDAPTAKTTRRSSARSGAAAHKAEYEGLIAGRDISKARRYRTGDTFAENEIVNHKTFGIGVITRVLSDKKVTVAFPAGGKVLVHER